MPDFVAALGQSNRIRAEVAKSALLDDLAIDLGCPQAMAFVRSVEVYGESLGMVNSTKNIDTLRSRCNVGLQTLETLAEQYPAIMALLRDAMGEDMIAAAGDRMAELAEEKVAALCAKALAAKTDATRDKHIAAAKAKAEELIALGYLTPAQAAALRASIQKHLAPKAAAPATVGTLVIPLFEVPYDDPDVGKTFVVRSGKSVEADAAFYGWTGGDIDEMRAALSVQTNPIDRHHLLQELVQQTYRRRKEPAMAALCQSTAETYLAEFAAIFPVLLKDWKGETYHISVFQHFATLLTEQGDYARAIQVCELALSKGLHDGTVSGFEGRIERIKKAAAKAA